MESGQSRAAVADFLLQLHSAADPLGAESGWVARLRVLIPCDMAAYRRVGGGDVVEATSGVDLAVARPLWAHYHEMRDDDPLPGVSYRSREPSGLRLDQALRSSDVVTDREFRSGGFYAEMCRPLGTKYLLKLFTDVRDGGIGIVLESSDRDFSDDDVNLLTALAPHFALAGRRRDTEKVPIELAERLSDREQQVALLVAEGLRNSEIAATLIVAQGTVRKHLDNIYNKTGVNNRTALARIVSGHGAIEEHRSVDHGRLAPLDADRRPRPDRSVDHDDDVATTDVVAR